VIYIWMLQTILSLNIYSPLGKLFYFHYLDINILHYADYIAEYSIIYKPVSQWVPLYPVAQMQVYPSPGKFVQFPPFWQGLLKQSSISKKQ